MKVTYIAECEHIGNFNITDKECLKRHIHIFNPKSGQNEILSFCNDWLKLNSQQNSTDNLVFKEKIMSIIEKEICSYLNLKANESSSSSKSLSGFKFNTQICYRPFVSYQFTIKDLAGYYFDNPNNETMNILKEKVDFFLQKYQSKLSTSKYKTLITLSNKLKNWSVDTLEKREIIFSDLINEIFKITIKNN